MLEEQLVERVVQGVLRATRDPREVQAPFAEPGVYTVPTKSGEAGVLTSTT